MDAALEVEIGAGPSAGTYSVHVSESLAGGEPSATIALDVGRVIAALPQIEAGILASSVAARRVMSGREAAVHEIGRQLFDAVFAGRIGEAYRASAAVAAERGVAPRLVLRLTAPELAALPWEAMFDSDADRYVSRKEPLVRRVASPTGARTDPIAPPLRILGMVSSPRGLEMLDVDAEKERLRSALAEHIDDGRVELTWLEDTSWGGLHSALLSETWHILHFIGHGGYDEQAEEGLIALVGRDGRADFVPASSLADLLNEARVTPRLVVLNSCESGTAGTSDLFAGTAATLAHTGIPAVVAMQFAVTDYAAVAFARGFYVALANGRSIDEAVRSGRIGILGITRGTLEWMTPVLYLAGTDTALLSEAAPASPRAAAVGESREGMPTPSREPDRVPGPPRDAAVVAGPAELAEPAPEPTVVATREATAEPARESVAEAGPAPESAPGPRPSRQPEPPSRPPDPEPPSPPSGPEPAGDDDRPARKRLLIGLGVAAAGIAALGIAWGALAIWGDRTPDDATDAPASPAATAEPTPTVLPPVAVSVAADQAWSETGVSCDPGDVLTITATGQLNHDADPNSLVGPEGLVLPDGTPDPVYLPYRAAGMPDDVATASLIGSLDLTEPFAVGPARDYTCLRSGVLFLGINDSGLTGNHGAWQATVVRTDNPPAE